MGTTNVTTPLVQPSGSDINGGNTGDGKTGLEKYVRKLFQIAGHGISYVISGGQLPNTQANLTQVVPAGEAYISGYYITWVATNVTLPASNTSHIFVKLTFSGSIVSGVQIEDNTTGTHPSDAVKLGTSTTSGTAITSSVDQRLLGNPRFRRTVISATGLTNWIVPANITQARIRQFGAGGGGGGGGGGTGGGFVGGNGAWGHYGGYVEAVVSVTPGATIAVTNGAGGTGGSGGAGDPSSPGTANAGGAGGAGGTSTVVGTGFSFTASGGQGGNPGQGADGTASTNGAAGAWVFGGMGGASASVGTADVLNGGAGMSPGSGGAGGGAGSSGVAGTVGKNAITIIEY